MIGLVLEPPSQQPPHDLGYRGVAEQPEKVPGDRPVVVGGLLCFYAILSLMWYVPCLSSVAKDAWRQITLFGPKHSVAAEIAAGTGGLAMTMWLLISSIRLANRFERGRRHCVWWAYASLAFVPLTMLLLGFDLELSLHPLGFLVCGARLMVPIVTISLLELRVSRNPVANH